MHSKFWALCMMLQGHKVKNQYFSPGEYLRIVDGVITSEDGYNFEDWFKNIRTGEEWKLTGWSVHNE